MHTYKTHSYIHACMHGYIQTIHTQDTDTDTGRDTSSLILTRSSPSQPYAPVSTRLSSSPAVFLRSCVCVCVCVCVREREREREGEKLIYLHEMCVCVIVRVCVHACFLSCYKTTLILRV